MYSNKKYPIIIVIKYLILILVEFPKKSKISWRSGFVVNMWYCYITDNNILVKNAPG